MFKASCSLLVREQFHWGPYRDTVEQIELLLDRHETQAGGGFVNAMCVDHFLIRTGSRIVTSHNVCYIQCKIVPLTAFDVLSGISPWREKSSRGFNPNAFS